MHHIFCSQVESSLCPLCSLCSARSLSACPTHCLTEAMAESEIDLRALSSVSDCCAPIEYGGERGACMEGRGDEAWRVMATPGGVRCGGVAPCS